MLYRFQGFNNESIRAVAACREALTEARFEAEQRENDNATDGTDTLVKVTATTAVVQSVGVRTGDLRGYDVPMRMEQARRVFTPAKKNVYRCQQHLGGSEKFR